MESASDRKYTMASSDSTVQPDMDAGRILNRAISIARDDVRISGVLLVATFLSSIPLVGWLLQSALSGLGLEFADETVGNSRAEESIVIRLILSIISMIVVFVAVGFGFVLLIIPGIYLALKFSLVLPAIWLDDIGPIEALSESWNRTDGNLGTILGVELVLFFISAVAVFAAFIVFVPFTQSGLQTFNQQPMLLAYPAVFGVQLLVAVTVGAVGTAAHTLMYRSFSR